MFIAPQEFSSLLPAEAFSPYVSRYRIPNSSWMDDLGRVTPTSVGSAVRGPWDVLDREISAFCKGF
jgi:hypothetical protein